MRKKHRKKIQEYGKFSKKSSKKKPTKKIFFSKLLTYFKKSFNLYKIKKFFRIFYMDSFKGKKIGVLCGGLSSEREISLRSGKNVYNTLMNMGLDVIMIDVDRNIVDKLKQEKIDIAFIMLHGRYGEDGCIQGLLEILDIPYTGPGVLASSVGMNKRITKRILSAKGIPVPESIDVDFDNPEKTIEYVKNHIKFPVIIKPNCEGSSIGVIKIDDEKKLREVISNYEFKDCFIEKYVEGKEITAGGILTKDGFIDLPLLGLIPQNEFYDFDAKYTKGKTIMELPAKVSKAVEEKIKKYIETTFYELDLYGVARLDVIIDKDDNPYFLEVNTIPGMTETSDIPAMAKAKGMSMEELVLLILKSAFK